MGVKDQFQQSRRKVVFAGKERGNVCGASLQPSRTKFSVMPSHARKKNYKKITI